MKRKLEDIHFEGLKRLTEWQGSNMKYDWQCEKGHIFSCRYKSLDRNGGKCLKCNGFSKTIEDCQALAKLKNGECLSTEYINNATHLNWKCHLGHMWQATMASLEHYNSWCPHCAGSARRTIQDCQALAIKNEGRCLSTEYTNNIAKMLWECKNGHNFLTSFNSINNYNSWCPRCVGSVSKPEALLLAFVQSLYIDTLGNRAGLLANHRYRLDIYIPSLKKAVEFDGDYWHSFPNAILNDAIKDQQCKEVGIQLLRIKECDYRKDPESVKERILNFLKLQ